MIMMTTKRQAQTDGILYKVSQQCIATNVDKIY